MTKTKSGRAALDDLAEQPIIKEVDGTLVRRMFSAGAIWLENNVPLVNSLNVFPVPDGDTGTNMLLTIQAAVREANANGSHNAGEIYNALSRGALLGARGNSGVIFSQILRGMARAVDKRETIEARLFADSFVEGAHTAYKGVIKPVEGTILTVIREAGDRAVIAAAQSNDIRFVLQATHQAAQSAVQRTPQLLPILKEAGVVDAGGQGLAFILEGALKYLAGETLESTKLGIGAQHLENLAVEEGFGYDIQFHIRGNVLNVDEIREKISAMGESALIVGDETLIKVHIHALNPGDILKYGAEQGPLVNIIIENMQAQYADFMAGNTADMRIGAENLGAILPLAARPPAPTSTDEMTGVATIAVAPGEGLKEIFQSLGVSAIVSGGPTMNPSAQELLDAINSVKGREIILLPNDKNIIPVAQQVQQLTDKKTRVVPSRTVPQGLAALLAFNFQGDLDTNVRMMGAALNRVRTVELTHAVRSAQVNGMTVQQGKPIALLDGELVASGDELTPLLLQVLHQAGAQNNEIVTLYFGSEVTPSVAQETYSYVQHEFPDQVIEIHAGGQPLYPYIISIE
ncbi:MAG: DAK2 domain-containing protein [Chloroflexota bacterium]|nr:MAG: DAK2 domain-containing protein [Chloroflexota bacterium]